MIELCYETNNYSPRLEALFSKPVQRYPLLTEQLEAAAQAGFQFVGIDRGSVEYFLGRDNNTLKDIRKAMDRLPLQCLEVADISILDNQDATLSDATMVLDMAQAFGAQYVQAGIQGDLKRVGECARQLEKRVTDVGAKLALEYMPFSPLNSIQVALDFMEREGLENTVLVIDNWHFFMAGDQWAELEGLPVERIGYVQFSDYPVTRSGDLLCETVNGRVLPGEGHFDLERFCKAIKSKGYNKPVSVEVLSEVMRDKTPQEFAMAEYRAARRYW